jgi:hypothetical protein
MTPLEGLKITGSLGFPSKMPGATYSLPAKNCLVGAKLAKIPNSVCHGCYALTGRYRFPNVKNAMEKRLASITHPLWVEAMVVLISEEYKKACREFTDQIRKHEKLVNAIVQKPSTATSSQNLIRGAGSGSAPSTSTDTAITQKPEELNPATYPLTLPHSGATVAISRKDLNCTTSVAVEAALIRTIWKWLNRSSTSVCTLQNTEILLPDGLHLTYYFRFHDSGDLQSVEHLKKIMEVAWRLPKIRFWLPTRELGILKAWSREVKPHDAKWAYEHVPPNLLIRLSSTMVDDKPRGTWTWTSTVHGQAKAYGRTCPAPRQDNNCGSCRNCWSAKVVNVSYHKH